jgi:hypothetical protein
VSDSVSAFSFLIDDEGEVWPESALGLRGRLVASLEPQQFVRFAVFNLGYVHVQNKGRGLALRLRPDLVSGRTFAGLMSWLHYRPDAQVSFSWYCGGWHHQIVTGRRQLRDMLSYLVGAVAVQKPPALERILVQPRPLKGSPFSGQIEKCRQIVNGRKPKPENEFALDSMFHRRWSLLALDTETGRLTMRHCAKGYPPFDPIWCSRPNASFDELYDGAYGQSVTRAHRAAVRRKSAVIDDVDAIVSWPRFGETRARYTRMILPVGREPGSLVFLSAACNAYDVDLRRNRVQIGA